MRQARHFRLQTQLGICAVADSARTAVVNAAKEFDASDRVFGGCKAFEAEHSTGSGLDPTMILLDPVVLILGRPQLRARGQYPIVSHFSDRSMRRGKASRVMVCGGRPSCRIAFLKKAWLRPHRASYSV
jgi:hypothetical protein